MDSAILERLKAKFGEQDLKPPSPTAKPLVYKRATPQESKEAAVAPSSKADPAVALLEKFCRFDAETLSCATDDCMFNPPGAPPMPIGMVLDLMNGSKAAFPEWKSVTHGVSKNEDGSYTVLTQQLIGPMKGDFPAMGPFPSVSVATAAAEAKEDLKWPVEVGTFTLSADGTKVAGGTYDGAVKEVAGVEVSPCVSAIWNKKGDQSDTGFGAAFIIMGSPLGAPPPPPPPPAAAAAPVETKAASTPVETKAASAPAEKSYPGMAVGSGGSPGAADDGMTDGGVPGGLLRWPAKYKSFRDASLCPEYMAKFEEEMGFTPEQKAQIQEWLATVQREGIAITWGDNIAQAYRFLQARQWDMEKSLAMYRNHVAWRKSNDLDTNVDTPHGPVPKLLWEFKFPPAALIKKAYPFVHHKVDKGGRPVYFDLLGKLSLKEMTAACPAEQTQKYFVWYAEASLHYRLPCASVAAGRYIGKGTYIVDLKGFGITSFTADVRAFMKDFTKIMSDNYPECMYRTVCINTPFIFRTVWNVISPMLDKRTRAKIMLLAGEKDYLPVLCGPKSTIFETKDDLPTQYGGKDDSLGFVHENGPWAQLLPDVTGTASSR